MNAIKKTKEKENVGNEVKATRIFIGVSIHSAVASKKNLRTIKKKKQHRTNTKSEKTAERKKKVWQEQHRNGRKTLF